MLIRFRVPGRRQASSPAPPAVHRPIIGVAVRAAYRERFRPRAVRTAIGTHRQRDQNLLPQRLAQVELVILVDARDLIVCHLVLPEVESPCARRRSAGTARRSRPRTADRTRAGSDADHWRNAGRVHAGETASRNRVRRTSPSNVPRDRLTIGDHFVEMKLVRPCGPCLVVRSPATLTAVSLRNTCW